MRIHETIKEGKDKEKKDKQVGNRWKDAWADGSVCEKK